MYDLSSVQRKISKEGVDNFIYDLSSGKFSDDEKKELTNISILSGGYPNLSLIYFLA